MMKNKYTIRDIAKLAGVTPTTVSKILNNKGNISEETKKKVGQIIHETGYRPSFSAKSLASNKSNLIGVIIGGEFNVGFTHPFFSIILNHVRDIMAGRGYDFIFFSVNSDYVERCRHYNVAGCLIISGDQNDEGSRRLDQSDIPVVGVDMELSGKRSSYVMTDNLNAAEKVVEYAAKQAIRSLGFIGGNRNSFITMQREAGFRRAMESYGLKPKAEWFAYGDYFDRSGYREMNRMLESSDIPELVFACSDYMALGAVEAIKERGLTVPGHISVIGYDDIDACRFSVPKLTTVRQDTVRIGQIAAQMLIELIEEDRLGRTELVEPQLMIRESSKAR